MTNQENNKEYTRYTSVQFYIILTCGIVLILVGLYLAITKNIAYDSGTSGMTKRKSWGPAVIEGKFVILFGMIICAYPLYYLYRKRKKRN